MIDNLFSIITVTYNRAHVLKNALNSVLNQSYKDFEYIVIDGKSGDKTVDILKDYKNKFKEKKISFKFISEEDDGLYDAMNKGIKMANGKYIGIVNSDDYYFQDTLNIVSSAIIKNSYPDIVHGNMVTHSKSGSKIIIKPDLKVNIFKNIPTLHPATFIRKDVFFDIGLYDVSYSIAADQDFLLSAFMNGKRFSYIDEELCYFSTEGISSSNIFKPVIESYIVKRKHKLNIFLSFYHLLRSLTIRLLQRTIFFYPLKKLFGRQP